MSTIETARVISNEQLCREHFRLRLGLPSFPDASPGQFVHLCAGLPREREVAIAAKEREVATRGAAQEFSAARLSARAAPPMLRRAFSIAGLAREDGRVALDVIYRVVGRGTSWMASLQEGDVVSVLGPSGRAFPIHAGKPLAYLVAGGVGLPPMLWLAEALAAAGKESVAICGARTADLLPLSLDRQVPLSKSGREAKPASREFAASSVPVVLSTDDGSLGFQGHVGEAFVSFRRGNPVRAESVVVYTCGPEPMMRFVADFCTKEGITCYVCMERSMACGMGTCQSCVVAVSDDADPDGWSYELCCTDGPVFEADRIVWNAGD